MKHSFKKLKNSKIAVEVILTADDVRPYYDRVYGKAIGSVKLKGFRPGMAPESMAESAIDKHAVMESAIQDAIRHSLNAVIEENDWTVVDAPRVEIISDEKSIFENKGLTFKADLTLYPALELPDYKKIAHKVMADKKEIKVAESEIKESLDWLRKSRAPLVLAAREAKKGDVVEVSITTSADGKDIGGGKVEGDRFELGAGKFIPGFEEKIEGHKAGEDLKFTLTAPADYWKKDLRDKKLDFEVKLKSVFEAQAPELNDDFAKSLGKFETLEALKQNIIEGLKSEKEAKEAERKRVKILEEVVTGTKTELPEIFVERTIDGLVEEHRRMIDASGENKDEVRKSLREPAEKRVTANLVITEIAKKEGLEPAKEEIEEESKYRVGENKGMDAGRFYDYIYGILLNRKAFEFLEKQ